jgi:hypothetical protein
VEHVDGRDDADDLERLHGEAFCVVFLLPRFSKKVRILSF